MSTTGKTEDIKMHHLNYFIQVATSGSLVKAVEVLGVTQPAVSVAINDLEKILGVALFRRRPTGMELTSFGETFLHHVLAARANIAEAVVSVRDMKSTLSGQVRIGIVPMDAVPFVHEGVISLKQTRPGILISIITGGNDRLLPELKIGGIDFVIGREAGTAMMSDLIYEPLFSERMAVISWPTSVYANSGALSLADLTEAEWCMPLPNTVIRERIEDEFAQRSVDFPTNRVDGAITTILGTLSGPPESTVVVVLCPYSLARTKIETGEMIELPVEFDKALPPTGLTWRRDAKPSESAGLLMDEFRRISAETKH
jgi:DNA-binding transcriptional LysR family regulator